MRRATRGGLDPHVHPKVEVEDATATVESRRDPANQRHPLAARHATRVIHSFALLHRVVESSCDAFPKGPQWISLGPLRKSREPQRCRIPFAICPFVKIGHRHSRLAEGDGTK